MERAGLGEKEFEGEWEMGLLLLELPERRVWASWLGTAPTRAIDIARATWMKGC